MKPDPSHDRYAVLRRACLCVLGLILAFSLCACGDGGEGGEGEEPVAAEIALVTDAAGTDDQSFKAETWAALQAFGEEYEKGCESYAAKEDGEEAYLKAVDEAVAGGAKIVFLSGNQFETTALAAQEKYGDVCFVLIDGVPRDKDHNYSLAANSTGVLFAEEEAGYLAGYAAVCDGYKKLGFIGGKDLPPVKRYGVGFVQGAAAAAGDREITGVEMKYAYAGTFEAGEKVEKGSAAWYDDGTQVIFACGGPIGTSVMKSAEAAGGKVIGVDADQSQLSETVITSAKKEIRTAADEILKTWIHNNFKGNSVFNYSLKNEGVSLEMTNARFQSFDQSNYMSLVNEITSGEKTIGKEAGDKSLNDLAGDRVTVEEATSDFQD